MPSVLNKWSILKRLREKGQVTYKGRPIRITPNFSPETRKGSKNGGRTNKETTKEHNSVNRKSTKGVRSHGYKEQQQSTRDR